ncbi:MAG: SDR family NAD(P)-dependent oxidoreductase [Mycobacterium sp.]
MGRDGSGSLVIVVLDGDTDVGFRRARRCLADGHRVAVVSRHPGGAIRVIHGYRAEQVMVIVADPTEPRQWRRVTDRVVERFGRIDEVVHGADADLLALA